MSAHELAVWVLCYGLGYSLMLHCNIGVALGGLVVVGFFAQQRHADASAILTAYSLGVVACWVLKRRWLPVGGYRWRLARLFPDFSTWRFWQRRQKTADSNRESEGNSDYNEDFRGGQGSADYRRRADEAREQRAEEARTRRQQEDARKGHKGTSGGDQRQEHTQERTEDAPKQEQRQKQREQEQSHERKQEDAQSGQQSEQGKTITEPRTDTRTPEQVLGVQPGCSYDELKKAYRLQCQRLHPDRWQDRPPPLRALLEEEQKRVNMAFQKLEKQFK